MRGFTLSLREKEFVEASRSLGAGNTRIIFREIMPNLLGPIIVYTTLLIPQSILFEAALSYLGLGVPPDTASWGGLLNDAQRYYDVAWWLMLFPGLFLVVTTLAFNLLGDGLRDALDVRGGPVGNRAAAGELTPSRFVVESFRSLQSPCRGGAGEGGRHQS